MHEVEALLQAQVALAHTSGGEASASRPEAQHVNAASGHRQSARCKPFELDPVSMDIIRHVHHHVAVKQTPPSCITVPSTESRGHIM